MIRVEMSDGTYLQIAPRGLELLLRHSNVRRFLRDTGWAEVGRDPLRGSARHANYLGPERRRNG